MLWDLQADGNSISDSRAMFSMLVADDSKILDGCDDEFRVVIWLNDDACSRVPWRVNGTALCASQIYTSRPLTA